MKIDLKKSALEGLDSDALIVFVAQRPEGRNGASKTDTKNEKKGTKKDEKASRAYVEGVNKSLQAKIQVSIDEGVISAGQNEVVFFRDTQLCGARHLMTVGLGPAREFDHEHIRQATASAINSLKGTKTKSVALAFDSLPHNSISGDATIQAITEGALLAEYVFNDFKEKKENSAPEKLTIVSSTKAKSYEHGAAVGTTMAECVNFARWLGDRPGNRMTPTILAEETVKAAKGTKLKVNIWDRARIKQEKMGSFLSVANGSSQEPKFIIMEYSGTSSSKRPICLVGKGLTFDCGGISIKPSAGMEEMKYDMCGGAAVIASMLAIAKLKLKVNAIAFVPATENLVGPNATKPGDIVTARNGKSIEVNNTDAEGRLILADALVYACEQDPAMILDAATLTGAMVVALGNIHTGFFTRNDKLASRINEAGEASGELLWRMPLTDHHVKDMRGTYADLSNISASKGAGSATAAGFLEQFVKKEIPWAHFDVAGTAWNVGDRLPYCHRKGASGSMVRTFVQIAMNHE